jgi:hypothetical protein
MVKARSVFLTLLLLILVCTALVQAQAPQRISGLPLGARILERRNLSREGHPSRTLVLWMLNPERHERDKGEIYTCPESTRGSYYSGPTRISLLDEDSQRIINTIEINPDSNASEGEKADDSFDIPYSIRAGYYYHVPNTRKEVEGKPEILWLKDFNGDGKALEFAIYDAEACMGLQTSLIGYSEKQDRLIQYPVELTITNGGKEQKQMSKWVDYLFSKTPVSPGTWKYEIDYRGRAGTLDKYSVRYDPASEMFRGALVSVPGE